MRKERKTEVFSKMKGLYGGRRYLGEVRKSKEYDGLSRRI